MASRDRARRLADLSAEALSQRRQRIRRITLLWPALQYLAWVEEAQAFLASYRREDDDSVK